MSLPEVSTGIKYVNMTDVHDPARREGPNLYSDPAERVEIAGETAEERERLIACVELLFFAYRDFTADPDVILERYGFGRAHHRVLHFVYRNPGLRVADLLDILKITKQSLSRVLKHLVDQEFIVQKAGKVDRRERLLYPTAKGARLTERLTELQVARIRAALEAAGSGGDETVRRFLFAMIGNEDKDRVQALARAHTGSTIAEPT